MFDDILPFEKTCFMYKNKADLIRETVNLSLDRLVAKGILRITEEHNKKMERLSSKGESA